ncbi:MAG: aminotransferase class I/II-fold pyridoxal phosphate-dependent enzyme [Elusimicrobia bacterium]|nr:aminotransferase class I/II-fold pyridoxal phosphate-dependent enzyme [Elusimicrobiota bacterium]
MHPLAVELNDTIKREAPEIFSMFSGLGREFYFPKGILTQTAEARQKAKRFNATIGIAKEKGEPMFLAAVMDQLPTFSSQEALNYAPSFGSPELRQAWKKEVLEKNPSLTATAIGTPVVTCGITHGLSVVADMFSEAGDVVFVPDQYWENYSMVFGLRRGARMVRYPLFSTAGGFDVDGFTAALRAVRPGEKALVLLNFPNNPTGFTPTKTEAEAIAKTLVDLAQGGRRFVALCDDAYFGLGYEPSLAKESLFAQLVHRHANILPLKLDGVTKEDYVWGFRVGFLTFPGPAKVAEALEKKAAGLVRGAISNVSQLTQSAILKAMSAPSYKADKSQKYDVLKARYDKVKAVLAQPEYAEVWTPYPFNSGYFFCMKLKGLNAEAFRLTLLDKYGVGVIATAPTDVRVAFSCLEVGEVEPMFSLMRQAALELKGDPKATDLTLYAEAFQE